MPTPSKVQAPSPLIADPTLAVLSDSDVDFSGGLQGNLGPLTLTSYGRARVEADTPLDVWTTADTNTGTHTAVTVSYAAPAADSGNVMDGVVFSYSGASAAGTLTIGYGSGPTTAFEVGVYQEGVYTIMFRRPKVTPAGQALSVTLSDGGSGAIGFVNVLGHRIARVPGQPARSLFGVLDFSDPAESGLI